MTALLDRLSRRTTSGRFIAEIDGLRFVSILLVVLFHLSGFLAARSARPFASAPARDPLARLLEHGHYGVQLFFVISGFVLALPFASHRLLGRPPVRLRSYFWRRVTRLEPPYIAAMTAILGLWLLLGHQWHELLPHWSAGLVYAHNLVFGQPNTLNVVAWSLEIEIQFYLLAPLFAAVFAIRRTVARRAIVGAAAVAATALQAALIDPSGRAALTILNFVQYFLMGFLLADVFLLEWREAPAPSGAWDIVSLVGWCALPALWAYPSATHALFPWVTLLLFMAAFRGRASRRVWSNRWVTTIGGMCYTVYLLHYPIVSGVGRVTSRWQPTEHFWLHVLLQSLLVLPAVLLVSVAFFAAIERPCMERDWPRRLAQRLRGRAARAPVGYSMDQAAP